MRSMATHRINPANLALLPAAALVAMLALRGPLGIQADPARVILLFLGAALVLALAICFPAAFLAPVLFLPKLKEVPLLSGMGPAAHWTALNLACGLVGAGIMARWLQQAALPKHAKRNPASGAEPADAVSTPAIRSDLEKQAVTAFLIFALVVAISYTYTISPGYGADKILRFLLLGGGLFFCSRILCVSRRDLRDFTVGTVLFGMVVAASSLRFSATGAMAVGANASHIGEGQAIGLAMLLLLYAPITQPKLRSVALLVCIPWLALGLIAAVTRGPLFSLLLVLLLSCFVPALRSPLISRRQMVLAGTSLVGALLLLSTFWFYGTDRSKFLYKQTEILSLLKGNHEARGTAVERLQFYRAACELWLEHPVQGWGAGAWSMAYWHQDVRRYPHNLFLEALMEEGMLGITALLVFLTAVLRRLNDCRQEAAALFPALLPCLIYLLLIAQFSDDLNGDRFIWFWCGLALTGCELAQRSRKIRGEKESMLRLPGRLSPSRPPVPQSSLRY